MNLKQFSSTKKGQLIICCTILALVWLVMLVKFGSAYLGDLPDKKKIEDAKKELEKVRTEFAKADKINKENIRIKKEYRDLASTAWLTSIDGTVETALRRKVSDISRELDFKLTRTGSVATGRINKDFVYADIDIQGAGDLEDAIRFLAGLAKIEPRLSWRRLDLRPDTRYRRQTGAGSANLAAQLNVIPKTRLNFNGKLRVLVYEGELTAKDLKITRQPTVDEVPVNSEYPENGEFPGFIPESEAVK